MSGMGKQAVKLKAVSPKTAPVLSEKLTFTDNKKWWQQGKKKVVARRVRVLGLNVRRKLFCHGMDHTCNKEIKENACKCCGVCNRWYHMPCQLKSSEELDAICKQHV